MNMMGNSAIPSFLVKLCDYHRCRLYSITSCVNFKILMLIIIILFGRRHERTHTIFGPGHSTSAIKSTSNKFSQVDLFERYDPVKIEHNSLQIMHLNITYRTFSV